MMDSKTFLTNVTSTVFRCEKMYSGVRCEHVIMDTHQLSSPEEVIGISCGVVLFLGIIVGLMYCCLKKR